MVYEFLIFVEGRACPSDLFDRNVSKPNMGGTIQWLVQCTHVVDMGAQNDPARRHDGQKGDVPCSDGTRHIFLSKEHRNLVVLDTPLGPLEGLIRAPQRPNSDVPCSERHGELHRSKEHHLFCPHGAL